MGNHTRFQAYILITMAATLILKVTFNSDTRKISVDDPTQLYQAIATRYGVEPERIQLSHEKHGESNDVDLDWLVALASISSSPLKVTMRLIEEPSEDLASSLGRDYRIVADEVNATETEMPIETTLIAHNGIWCDECSAKPIVGARYSKQLENDTYDLCKSCYDNLDEADQVEMSLLESSVEISDQEDAVVEAEDTTSDDTSGNTTSDEEEVEQSQSIRERADKAKLMAQASKEQARRLVEQAHVDAQAARHAEKAYKQAEKAAKKAAAQAEAQAKRASVLEAKAVKQASKAAKQAEKAERQAAKQAEKAAKKAEKSSEKRNKPHIIPGKLVNWLEGDAAAVMGELSVLPCGRVCFHLDGRKGNLCVPPAKGPQGLKVRAAKGGCGPWAQFEALVDEQKEHVFQLMSHPHRTTNSCFLGAVATEEDPTLTTAAGENYSFTLVARDSAESLWSFYPSDTSSPFLPGAQPQYNARPQADTDPRQVYNTLQQIVNDTAAATQLPLSMGDAPEDDAALVSMLNQLHQLLPDGIKKMAAKKLGLRKFEVPEVPEVVTTPGEWDLLMDELEEMGFEKSEATRQAVQAADGDLKQTIKQLMRASRNQ